MNRAALVAEALTWVGTPYHANQRAKGVGADCIGLVAGVALACGLDVPDLPLAYPPKPDGTLQPFLDANLVRIATEPQSGDILLISLNIEPHHLALVLDGARILHAYRPAGKVVMQPHDAYWKGVTRAVYRFPGVE